MGVISLIFVIGTPKTTDPPASSNNFAEGMSF